MGRQVDAKVRFFEKVEKDAETGCWRWTGALSDQGYGWFRLSKEHMGGAHRMSWLLFRGELPPKSTQLDHDCHNRDRSCPGGRTCLHRRCVNPDHLVVATPWRNVNEAGWRGTAPHGVERAFASHVARFLEEQAETVLPLRDRYGLRRGADLIREEWHVKTWDDPPKPKPWELPDQTPAAHAGGTTR